jgi:hypothetical protein
LLIIYKRSKWLGSNLTDIDYLLGKKKSQKQKTLYF